MIKLRTLRGEIICITQVGPKCNHKHPSKRGAEEDTTHTHREGSDVKTEVEIGVMQP